MTQVEQIKELTARQLRMKFQRVGTNRIFTLKEIQSNLVEISKLLSKANRLNRKRLDESKRLIELLTVLQLGDTAVSNLGFYTRVHHGRKNSLYA